MNGYLGTYKQEFGHEPNFGLLSSSKDVRVDFLRKRELVYEKMENEGKKPERITGRYKKVAEYVREDLQRILSNIGRLPEAKYTGGFFNSKMIRSIFLTLPIQDERDPINSQADSWVHNAESLAEEANNIIQWAKDNAEGPVSVI